MFWLIEAVLLLGLVAEFAWLGRDPRKRPAVFSGTCSTVICVLVLDLVQVTALRVTDLVAMVAILWWLQRSWSAHSPQT